MENEVNIQKILDDAVRDITKRLAGIDLTVGEWPGQESGEVDSLYTVTKGSYTITIVYHAEKQLIQYIAEKMARRTVEDPQDVEMYAKEYFNILCGHFISQVNRMTKSSARFGVPQYCHGNYKTENCEGIILEVSYTSTAGNLQVQSQYADSVNG